MANRNEKQTGNVDGAYYVDSTCIDCDLCRTTAPESFGRNAETGYSFVFEQPATQQQLKEAQEALMSCPTESIGNDG